MKMKNSATRSKLAAGGALLASVLVGASLPAQAGSLFLTGHDIDYHNNADGYDTTILSYLTGKTDLSAVTVSYLYGTGGKLNAPSKGVVASYNVATMTDAQWAQALTAQILEIGSEVSCGGCTIYPADITKIAARKSQIVDFFNAGGGIWGNTSANVAGYYDAFLPPSFLTSTAPVSGSTGFYATAAGAAVGITDVMVNGDQTHNSFGAVPAAFTILERRLVGSTPASTDTIISIGLKDGTITGGGGAGGTIITTPPASGGAGSSTDVPEPFTIVGTLIGGTAALRMRKKLKSNDKV